MFGFIWALWYQALNLAIEKVRGGRGRRRENGEANKQVEGKGFKDWGIKDWNVCNCLINYRSMCNMHHL